MRPSPESDRLLLGGLFACRTWADAKRLLDASGLAPEDISDSQIRYAFDLLQRRAQRRQTVDSMSVWLAGHSIKLFHDDDRSWLQSLEAASVLTDEQWLQLAEERRSMVRRSALARTLRELAGEIEGKEFSPAKVIETIDAAKLRVLKDYRGNRTAESDPAEMLSAWQARADAGKPLLKPTHSEIFDKAFGGLAPNLNIFGGAPGSMKTGFADGLILSQLRARMRVALVGLEDGYRHITRREMARCLKRPLRDIGSAQMSTEEWLKASEEGEQLSKLFRNLFVYKWGGIGPRDLVRLCVSWIVNEGVEVIWIDNATEINHTKDRQANGRGREEAYAIAVGQTAGALRDLAVDNEVPVVVLAHTTRDYLDKRPNKPPALQDLADASAWEKKVRMFIGVWRRFQDFRATSVKITEGEANVTARFELFREAALVDVDNGEIIDLDDEVRKEKANRAARLEEESVEASLRKADLKKRLAASAAAQKAKEAASAPAAKPDAPQLALLEAPAAPAKDSGGA